MKTISKITIALTALLLVAAVVLLAIGGVSGKIMNGSCAVRVDMGSSYDEAVVKTAIEKSGLVGAVVLSSGRTALEIQTSVMDGEKLSAAAQALVTELQGAYPSATLVYAEPFGASSGYSYTASSIWALVGFAVLAFAFGWIRFGWRSGLAAVCTSLCAVILTGGVCVLLSGLFIAETALLGTLAGVLCLTYIYTLYVYERYKESPDYAVSKADMAVPMLVAVACVLVFVSGGASVLKLMFAGLLGSVIAAICMHCVAPAFRNDFAKQAR